MVENKFIHGIEQLNNGNVTDFKQLELKKVIEEFPCFQSAYLLQAIDLKLENEELFQEQLPHLAKRVLNRAVLYDRVTYNYTTAKIETEQEKTAVLEAEPLVEIKSVEETPKTAETNVETEKTKEIDNDIPEVGNKEKIEAAIIDDEIDAIINESEQLLQEEALIEKPKEKIAKSKVKKEVKAKVKKQAIVSKVKKSVLKEKKEEIKTKVVKEKPAKSFTDWLKNKKSIDKVDVAPQKEVVEKNKEDIPLDMAASHEAALFLEAKKSSFKLEDFLVDQIERKQERKEKKIKDFTHAVSETYAKILVNQGKIEEAIHVYKELSIKYPKKSSNFTSQINNLKNNL